jgi:hypothetical protein
MLGRGTISKTTLLLASALAACEVASDADPRDAGLGAGPTSDSSTTSVGAAASAGDAAVPAPRVDAGSAPIPAPIADAGGAVATSVSADGGATAHGGAHDHCTHGYLPQASDETMKDGPAEFYPPGKTDPNLVDTTVQPEVLKWMNDNLWQAAHVEWHAIRGCSTGLGAGQSKVDICSFKQLVPKDQNCRTDGDGYQFLVFHRHMIQALKQLWPKHTEQFTGFPKFPTSAADVPPQWRSAWKDWDANALAAGKIGDEIDKPENLARFPNEGVLGFWLQCAVGQRLTTPANNMPFVGLHFLLHAKWARPGNTTHGVNNTESNIDNYMFWKLHGWIDNVWEKYRLAKGMLPTDAKLQADLVAQCREMDTEIQIIKNAMKPGTPSTPSEPLPVESGFFHQQVRPIFENPKNLCSGCHAETGANAMLSLGGNVSSKKIVAALVDKPARNGGQFKLVAPGDPDRSWLYLKAAGKASGAGCVATSTSQCIDGTMPPSSSGVPALNEAELATLRQWIQDGALGPP